MRVLLQKCIGVDGEGLRSAHVILSFPPRGGRLHTQLHPWFEEVSAQEGLYVLKPAVLCEWTVVKLDTVRRSQLAVARAAFLSALVSTLGVYLWLACSPFLAAVSAAGWQQGDHCCSLLTYAAVPVWYKLS